MSPFLAKVVALREEEMAATLDARAKADSPPPRPFRLAVPRCDCGRVGTALDSAYHRPICARCLTLERQGVHHAATRASRGVAQRTYTAPSQEKVLTVARASGRPVTIEEVSRALGWPYKTTASYLKRMVFAGRLTRPGRGLYEVPR